MWKSKILLGNISPEINFSKKNFSEKNFLQKHLRKKILAGVIK